ncbi:MAG TPA: GNAT family N-acetyltransferase [Flavisolibacter sp.]|jgi:GNAT superfamily N-acetyltransferase|nr:GNAT family N-acetyltransferase [Flavisolibacter sp.]
MEWMKDDYIISDNKGKVNVAYVHRFLSQSYWAEGIPLDVVQRSINGSLCFSVLYKEDQIGFARVITDEATFAYLCDVFIDEKHRGRGLSKWLMETVLAYPGLQGLRRFMLATRDAHSLYRQYHFVPLTFTDRWMHIHQPDAYKKQTGRFG